VPAFQCGLGPGAVILRRVEYGGPAGAVRLHLAQDGLAQVVPHVPAVTDLHGIRQPGG
jgi:hypothetical protein